MKQHAVLVTTLIAAGLVSACSDDSGERSSGAGAGGGAGLGGGAGTAGMGGLGGSAGTSGSAGATSTPPPPPTPALPANAPTLACNNTLISGSLDATDPTQTGRHSRIAPVSACGAIKAFPGNAADPSNPHLFDVYRFANLGTAATCFNLELSYGTVAVAAGDAGLDAGADDVDAGTEPALDAGADAGDAGAAPPPAPRYMTAYSTFYPTALANSFLGDVGANLAAPQTLGVTVPAGGTIDVVVYAVDVAPLGTGAYTLRCTSQ